MEDTRYFVNSRGILKSCDFHSNKPKSSCKDDKSYLNDMIKSNNMFDGMSIYVCSDLLLFFVNNILSKIKNRFVLVSGDSDLCVPLEVLSESNTNKLLSSQYLIKWFAQNTRFCNHDKIIQLPIGLDYHTISNNPNHGWRLPSEGHLPVDQEIILNNMIKISKPFDQRKPKIYVCFSKNTDRFNDRKKSLKIIPNNLLKIINKTIPRTKNWQNILAYTFVLSPFGNGMDCHRTWETLALGSIPIIRAPKFKNLFEDLPVLIVENWSDVNEELLNNTIENFKTKTFKYEKLQLKYWVDKIKDM
jgi:hypothetical protein